MSFLVFNRAGRTQKLQNENSLVRPLRFFEKPSTALLYIEELQKKEKGYDDIDYFTAEVGKFVLISDSTNDPKAQLARIDSILKKNETDFSKEREKIRERVKSGEGKKEEKKKIATPVDKWTRDETLESISAESNIKSEYICMSIAEDNGDFVVAFHKMFKDEKEAIEYVQKEIAPELKHVDTVVAMTHRWLPLREYVNAEKETYHDEKLDDIMRNRKKELEKIEKYRAECRKAGSKPMITEVTSNEEGEVVVNSTNLLRTEDDDDIDDVGGATKETEDGASPRD